ncbi:MAG: 50S ribosomal protein L3 [Candidatus Dormibacteria bacterium]|jgi:large subunit ribosomal protein L3|nr:50S ribosomal protein L3 [Chloroflexota bacterium]HBV93454.1 50S ribosomal protein L3 [Chloroflexota bacterium]
MSKGLLARKLGMTQLFTAQGTVVPVTVLEADSCHVVQVKTTATDGYEAVQLGLGVRRPRRTNKPQAGHFKRAGTPALSHLAEVRDAGTPAPGSRLSVSLFEAGERVDVTGITQGKGFAGQHKRHNFSRGPVTHGSHNIKQPGSIGSTDAARVFKGLRMAGHLGASRATVMRLEVVRVDAERNLLLVRGAVPGHRDSVVLVRDSARSGVVVA